MADVGQLYQKVRVVARRSALTVEKFRAYNIDGGVREYRTFLAELQEIVQIMIAERQALAESRIAVSPEYIVDMMKGLLNAQEQKDYVLLADLLELQTIPFLREALEQIRQSKEGALFEDYTQKNLQALEERDPALAAMLRECPESALAAYEVEDTMSGFPTCRVTQEDGSFYLHSNQDPYAEARAWTREMPDEQAMSYHVLGCGLGYHGPVLCEELKQSYPVHLYESDIGMLRLAIRFCDMSEALRGQLYLHSDPDYRELAQMTGEDGNKLCVHYPSLRRIREEKIRQIFERYFVQDSSYRNAKVLLQGNFDANMAMVDRQPEKFAMADELLAGFRGKTLFLVAAGPSLDKNIAMLPQCREQCGGLVIACGTVFRKLIGMGITPDYVMVTDANPRVLLQIRSLEQTNVPMLMLSTANHGFAQKYQAKHYMMLQQGYPRAEREAKKRGCMCFETGGSVMTTALDAAVRLGAGKIIFLGLDLAFTGQLAHATGTSNRIATDTKDLTPVKAWGGGTVYADQKFIIYRTWMERRLKEADAAAVTVINATEGGSYIEGMKHMTLAEACGG